MRAGYRRLPRAGLDALRAGFGRMRRADLGALRARFGRLPRVGFGRSSGPRARPRWKELRPLLLRSAGAVGLAGMIVAVISNEGLFSEAEKRPERQARIAVQHQAIEPTIVAAISVHDATDIVTPRPGVFARAPGSSAASPDLTKDVARLGPAANAAIAPAPAAPAAAEPVPVELAAADATAVEPPAADPAPLEPPATDAASVEPATARIELIDPPAPPPSPALVRAAAARAAQAGTHAPAPAADCPRDWIKLDGIGELPAACGEAAALIDMAAVPDDQQALEKAALERASEIAGLQFAPRIPKMRPEPPPRAARAKSKSKSSGSRKARAGWPSDPPPKCGAKRAKWRYVSDVPTWYCK